VVFTDDILRPELQDLEEFADGMDNVIGTQKRVATNYFKDGSVESACPPLKALLHIMMHDHFEGKGLEHPEIRQLFDRETVLSSYWYQARLKAKQNFDVHLAERHVAYLEGQIKHRREEGLDVSIHEKGVEKAREFLSTATSIWYMEKLEGTIGGEPAIWENHWNNVDHAFDF
jgi:hypothetical protein